MKIINHYSIPENKFDLKSLPGPLVFPSESILPKCKAFGYEQGKAYMGRKYRHMSIPESIAKYPKKFKNECRRGEQGRICEVVNCDFLKIIYDLLDWEIYKEIEKAVPDIECYGLKIHVKSCNVYVANEVTHAITFTFSVHDQCVWEENITDKDIGLFNFIDMDDEKRPTKILGMVRIQEIHTRKLWKPMKKEEENDNGKICVHYKDLKDLLTLDIKKFQ